MKKEDAHYTKLLADHLVNAKGFYDYGIAKGLCKPESVKLTVSARQAIVKQMDKSGVSQRKIAKAVGVDQSTVRADLGLRENPSKSEGKSLTHANGQSDKQKSTYGGLSACDYDWDKPNPDHFKDDNEMYAAQADNYCHEAIHLGEAFPLLTKSVSKTLIKSKIASAQKVADVWTQLVAELRSRAK